MPEHRRRQATKRSAATPIRPIDQGYGGTALFLVFLLLADALASTRRLA